MTNDKRISTQKAREILRVPVHTFKEWHRTGEMDGVKHPACREYQGCANRYYDYSAVLKAKIDLPRSDYYPEPSVIASEWFSSMIRDHGRVEMLANAMRGWVTFKGKEATVRIKVADDVTGEAKSARSLIGRKGVGALVGVKRLKAIEQFPGVEFLVEVVE